MFLEHPFIMEGLITDITGINRMSFIIDHTDSGLTLCVQSLVCHQHSYLSGNHASMLLSNSLHAKGAVILTYSESFGKNGIFFVEGHVGSILSRMFSLEMFGHSSACFLVRVAEYTSMEKVLADLWTSGNLREIITGKPE